jgi:hypothetical protein
MLSLTINIFISDQKTVIHILIITMMKLKKIGLQDIQRLKIRKANML